MASFLNKFDSAHLERYPILATIEEKTGVPQKFTALGALLFGVLAIANGICSSLLANIFGFLYPAYESLKALETASATDDKKWLTYWVCYACFSILESVSDTLLFWIPFYYLLKILFLVWCMWPSEEMNGAMFVYNRVIRPVFLRNEAKVDGLIDRGMKKVEKHLPAGFVSDKSD